MKFTDESDFARSLVELFVAHIAQQKRIADTIEQFMPRFLEQQQTRDPMEKAVALMMQNPNATRQQFADAVGYSRPAIFPSEAKRNEQLARRQAGAGPSVPEQLRELYERCFETTSRAPRRGHNDGDGNVDGVTY